VEEMVAVPVAVLVALARSRTEKRIPPRIWVVWALTSDMTNA